MSKDSRTSGQGPWKAGLGGGELARQRKELRFYLKGNKGCLHNLQERTQIIFSEVMLYNGGRQIGIKLM